MNSGTEWNLKSAGQALHSIGRRCAPFLAQTLRSLIFLCSSSGPEQPYFSSGCPVKTRQSKHRRFIKFWNELNFTLEREGVGWGNSLWVSEKRWLNITCSIMICCHLLTKMIWYLQLPLNFIPIVAELGGSDRGKILIYLGAERELFFKWDRSNECFEHLILQWNPIFCHRFRNEARTRLEVRAQDAKWRL